MLCSSFPRRFASPLAVTFSDSFSCRPASGSTPLRAREKGTEKRGQIYFYYSNFSDCAHAELLKANNSLNHAPLPRHREIPLRHLNWSLHARKIRVEKINLSPLWSYEECSGGSVKITSAGAESLTVPMRPTPILMAQP